MALINVGTSLTSLTVLHLNNNGIVDISPLSSLTSLTNLHLYDNEITDVEPLAGLVNLQTLYLSGNNIADTLPLALLTANIDIAVNPRVTFPDTGLDGAVRSALGLDADANIRINRLKNLTELAAPTSEISDLTGLEYATQLTALNLPGNEIIDISLLSELTSLTTLDISTNEIVDISPLSGLTSLTTLDLTENDDSRHQSSIGTDLSHNAGRY